MVKQLSFITLLTTFFFLGSFEGNEKTNEARLTVEFNSIRNHEGKIFVFLYNYENQYPENPYLNFEIDKRGVSGSGKMKFTIPEILVQGKYAISVIDDENANEDLDMFLGVPTEGYAFSNNIRPFLSLPDYNDLLFDLSSQNQTIQLTLQYIL